jgi:hypothetical protein
MSHELCQVLAENGSSELKGDDKLLTALVSGCHIENAARSAGISERTAYRRLEDPEFRAKLEQSRKALRESILARLSDAGLDAISTLVDLLDSDDDNVRLKAAKTLLESLSKLNGQGPKTKLVIRARIATHDGRT